MGARNRYHLSFWRFFHLFYSNFGPNFEVNLGSEANCGVVTFSLVL